MGRVSIRSYWFSKGSVRQLGNLHLASDDDGVVDHLHSLGPNGIEEIEVFCEVNDRVEGVDEGLLAGLVGLFAVHHDPAVFEPKRGAVGSDTGEDVEGGV